MSTETVLSPTIVLILSDKHALHAICAYCSVVNRTSHIDEIAEHGWLLQNCFATNTPCSLSRASSLTGTYIHVNGVTTLAMTLDNPQPTFISLLKASEYRTAVVGKRHLGEGEGHDPEYFDPTFRSPPGGAPRRAT